MRQPSVLIFTSLISFVSIAAVLFTPALPEIAEVFGISPRRAEFSMTIFLIGYALGQLIYGPIANWIGRRGSLLWGFWASFFGTFLCMLAGWTGVFTLLIIGRIITALGASVGLVVTFIMIGDCFTEAKARRAVALILIFWAVLPGFGVMLGGFLTHQFGWLSCFYFLFIYNAWIIFLTYFLPETARPEDLVPIPFKQLAKGYGEELTHGIVVTGGTIMGLGTAIIYVMATRSPYVAIELLGYGPAQYGLLILIPQAGAVLGAILEMGFAKKLRTEGAILSGIILALVVALGMWMLQVAGYVNWITLFVTTGFIYLGIIFEYTGVSAIITTRAKNKARASSLMAFLNMLMPVIALFIIELIPAHWPLGIATIFCGCTIIMLILFLTVFSPLTKRENSA